MDNTEIDEKEKEKKKKKKKKRCLYARSNGNWYKILDMETLTMDEEEEEVGGRYPLVIESSAVKTAWPLLPVEYQRGGASLLVLPDPLSLFLIGGFSGDGYNVFYLDLISPDQGWKRAPSLVVPTMYAKAFAPDKGKICVVPFSQGILLQLLDFPSPAAAAAAAATATWQWDALTLVAAQPPPDLQPYPFTYHFVVPDPANRRILFTLAPIGISKLDYRCSDSYSDVVALYAYHLDDGGSWKCLNPEFEFNKQLSGHSVVVDDVLYSIHSESTSMFVYDLISNQPLPWLDLEDVLAFIPSSFVYWRALVDLGSGWLCLPVWHLYSRGSGGLIRCLIFRVHKDFEAGEKKISITCSLHYSCGISENSRCRDFLAF